MDDSSRAPAAWPLEAPDSEAPSTVRRTAAGHEGLAQTIEEQVIPKLMMAHRAAPLEAVACMESDELPTPDEVTKLADLSADQRLPDVLAMIEAQCAQGLTLETVLLHLVAPAARLLGDDWLEDERSFAEVTMGLGTLQRLVQILGPRVEAPMFHRGLVVLVAAPHEQHTLGIFVLGELLRQRGWGVHVEPRMSETDLLALVASEPVVALGISVSSADLLVPLPRLIARVTKASLRPGLGVLLGGTVDLKPLAAKTGAAACHSADDALRHLASWCAPAIRAVPN